MHRALRLTAVTAFAAIAAFTAGCGGGGGGSSGSGSGTGTSPQNVQAIIVDQGPVNNDVNVPFISITLCAAGTSTCQTIDHISVDTGSSGLRVISSVLTPTLAAALAQENDSSGRPIAECTQFADGYIWGPVKVADLAIAGEQAKSLPVQVIGDPAFSSVPRDCSSSGPEENSIAAFGSNGLIGVGVFQQDCGSICASVILPGAYYICPATGCTNALAPVNLQVQNPVALFANDNNGVVIQLSSISAAGQATVSGSLIFGVGTQSNNALGSATVLKVDPGSGYLTAVYNGGSYTDSYIDSGSSAFFLPSNLLPACPGNFLPYFCPPAPVAFTTLVNGINGAGAQVSFSVANAQTLTNNAPSFAAFNNLAAENGDGDSFDFGLPFFYGRTVYIVMENKTTPQGAGPFVAF
jgi:hypothetical protein